MTVRMMGELPGYRYDEPTLPDAIDAIREERDRLRSDIATLGTVEMMIRNPNINSWVQEHETRLEAAESERDRLRRELAERNAVCQAHMELRYNAERELARATEELGTAMDELAEIKRVLIAFHRQEGDGIVSVKRLAKRLYETAGGRDGE